MGERITRRRYRLRWRVALLLNRHPGVCYSQVAAWAHYGGEPERRVWVRTHLLTEAKKPGGWRYWVCRRCGERFDHGADVQRIEQEPCSTWAPDPPPAEETP